MLNSHYKNIFSLKSLEHEFCFLNKLSKSKMYESILIFRTVDNGIWSSLFIAMVSSLIARRWVRPLSL